jgi:hypothetical protein
MNRNSFKVIIEATAVLSILLVSVQAQPALSAKEILAKVDTVMGPRQFTALMEMRTQRADGSEKLYRMQMYRYSNEVNRIEFVYPPIEKGRVLLRKDKDMWMKMTTLKRPLRIAAKQQLMNGDFDNGDVMRLNLTADYTPTLKSDSAAMYVLELIAQDRTVAYDRVLLWVKKGDFMPCKAQYFTVSGALMRELEYGDYTMYGARKRPAKMMMRNMLNKKTFSEMRVVDFSPGKTADASKFSIDNM